MIDLNNTPNTTCLDGVRERSSLLDAQLDTCERGIDLVFQTLGALPATRGDHLTVAVETLEAWLKNHRAVAQALGAEITLSIAGVVGTRQ